MLTGRERKKMEIKGDAMPLEQISKVERGTGRQKQC
jgi:hypothetical protein